jgi:colanic acid/amylovoran biosynthesis glycosyltransferase
METARAEYHAEEFLSGSAFAPATADPSAIAAQGETASRPHTCRIGFLVPEFPGQTHIFLWREREALMEMGVEAAFVSTSRPPQAISSHAWSNQAAAETDYLMPFGARDLLLAALDLLRAGPKAWVRLSRQIFGSPNLSGGQRLRLAALLAPAAKLRRLARSRGWHHIHVHSCADAANVAMLARLIGGPAYSLTLHGPRLEDYGPNQENKWRHAAFAVVISEHLMAVVRARLGHVLPKRVQLAPMGVDLDQIKRTSAYQAWKSGGPCRLFSCGRLNPIKGHDHLLETVRLLREGGIDIRLRIAGEDEQGGKGYRQTLQALIQSKELGPYVELLGAVSEARIRQELEQAHLFTLASLDEGVSVAIMEAMAMAMPVVVTRVGGNHELISHDVDGLMVPPADPKFMAQAIARVLADPALALRLARASRATVASRFHHRRSALAIRTCLETA